MGQKTALEAMPHYHDLEAILWTGLLLCSLGKLGRGHELFINPVLNQFGKISYSLYLVHVPIQFYMIYPVNVASGNNLNFSDTSIWAAVAGSFLLSWLMAIMCYRLIELPFLRLKAHLPVFNNERQEGSA